MKTRHNFLAGVVGSLLALGAALALPRSKPMAQEKQSSFLGSAEQNSAQLVSQGKHIFRFDTFGDQAFWGDQLHLHQAINTLTPSQALSLGLKVDAEALSPSVIEAIKHGKVNLNDPAVTRTLIKANAVLGVVGFFEDNGMLSSVGLTCAVCHSTVDDSIAPGIGVRIDGLGNRDLNVGAIIAAAPNLQPAVSLLNLADPGITDATVRSVLNSWGPGKFDAELFLDGKAFNPQQITNGIITGKNVPGATLLPNARGLAGHNLHTWSGGWGTVTYWNALVAVLELHGKGTFFDERFDNADQFPIAAKAGLVIFRPAPTMTRSHRSWPHSTSINCPYRLFNHERMSISIPMLLCAATSCSAVKQIAIVAITNHSGPNLDGTNTRPRK